MIYFIQQFNFEYEVAKEDQTRIQGFVNDPPAQEGS
jgi:hypothetical protein